MISRCYADDYCIRNRFCNASVDHEDEIIFVCRNLIIDLVNNAMLTHERTSLEV